MTTRSLDFAPGTIVMTLPDGRRVPASDVTEHVERFHWNAHNPDHEPNLLVRDIADGRIEPCGRGYRLVRGWDWYVVHVYTTDPWGVFDVRYNERRIARIGGGYIASPEGYALGAGAWRFREQLEFGFDYHPVTSHAMNNGGPGGVGLVIFRGILIRGPGGA